jgi:hypothetical protein
MGSREARLLKLAFAPWVLRLSLCDLLNATAKVHHRASGERVNGKLALLRPRLSAQKQLNLLIHPKALLASIGPFLTALPLSLAQVLNQCTPPLIHPLSNLPFPSHHNSQQYQRWLPVPRTLVSRPLSCTSPARQVYSIREGTRSVAPRVPLMYTFLTFSYAVRRPDRAREVRWHRRWQVHHWSRPDQDVLLRRS